jgi:hypothetical protein
LLEKVRVNEINDCADETLLHLKEPARDLRGNGIAVR